MIDALAAAEEGHWVTISGHPVFIKGPVDPVLEKAHGLGYRSVAPEEAKPKSSYWLTADGTRAIEVPTHGAFTRRMEMRDFDEAFEKGLMRYSHTLKGGYFEGNLNDKQIGTIEKVWDKMKWPQIALDEVSENTPKAIQKAFHAVIKWSDYEESDFNLGRIIEEIKSGRRPAELYKPRYGSSFPSVYAADVEDLQFTILIGLAESQIPATDQDIERVVALTEEIGAQITGIDDSIRSEVQDIINTASDRGYSMRWVEKKLRDVLPISNQATDWIASYRSALKASGLDDATIRRKVDRYIAQLRKDRAATVAQMEMNRAKNADMVDSYREAMDSGMISPKATRTWVAGPDACPICEKRHGMKIPADETFPDGDPGELHVNCNCTDEYSEELPEAVQLAGFDPDQPRDEKGEWTASGSEGHTSWKFQYQSTLLSHEQARQFTSQISRELGLPEPELAIRDNETGRRSFDASAEYLSPFMRNKEKALIILYKGGVTPSTIAHELAHHLEYSRHPEDQQYGQPEHGPRFARAAKTVAEYLNKNHPLGRGGNWVIRGRMREWMRDLADWNEDDHPRVPAGSSTGGEFTSSGVPSSLSRQVEEIRKELTRELPHGATCFTVAQHVVYKLIERGMKDAWVPPTNGHSFVLVDKNRYIVDLWAEDKIADRPFVRPVDSPEILRDPDYKWWDPADENLSDEEYREQKDYVWNGYRWVLADFDESKHPRVPAGSSEGGEFTSSGEGLTSSSSGYSFEGRVFRAENTGRGDAALGKGVYYTPDKSVARSYGKDVREHHVKLSKVLGTNSREHEAFRVKALRMVDDDSVAERIAKMAKASGYDAIYAGPVFGLVVLRDQTTKMAEWNEEDHPRVPAGSEEGGEFTSSQHPYEARGLGKPPYRFLGVHKNSYQACAGAPIQAGGTCDYCGTNIMFEHYIRSSDGKESKVGSECINKSGDAKLVSKMKAEETKRKAELRRVREESKIQELDKLLDRPDVIERLKATPKPTHWNPNNTWHDYAVWMWNHAGNRGTIKLLKEIKETFPDLGLADWNEGQ